MATKFDPQNARNLVEVEKQFAVKAVEHAQVYWNLIERVEPAKLRLTRFDDEIFNHLSEAFPELLQEPYEGLTKIDEDWMKSAEGKKRWHAFIESYKEKIQDYNFGSLIRSDSRDEYSEMNTMFVMRMQFYAYEIARNRLGLNDAAHKLAVEEAEKERLKKEKEKAEAEKSDKKAKTKKS